MTDQEIDAIARRVGLIPLVGSDGSVAYRSGRDCLHVYLDELRAVVEAATSRDVTVSLTGVSTGVEQARVC